MEEFNFLDNTVITLEQINAIPGELTLAESLAPTPIAAADSYSTGTLNQIRAALVTAGVQKGCTAAGVDGKVVIGEGICFFNSGAMLEIFSGGTELSFTPLTLNYVYLKCDPETNFIGPVISLEEQAGDVVPICRVEPDGSIVDTRFWCNARFAMPNSNFVQTARLYAGEYIHQPIPLATKNFRYVLMTGEGIFVLYDKAEDYYYFANKEDKIIEKSTFYCSFISKATSAVGTGGFFTFSTDNMLQLHASINDGKIHVLDFYII